MPASSRRPFVAEKSHIDEIVGVLRKTLKEY